VNKRLDQDEVWWMTATRRQQTSIRRSASRSRKGTATAGTLDTARAAYIQLLGSLGSNAEVKAEVTRFREQLDQMQLVMLGPKPPNRRTRSSTST
jgi:hypothetical protein